MQVAQLFCDKG